MRKVLSFVQKPIFRALLALAAQLVATGFWAMIDPAFVAHHAVGFVLIGLAIFIVAYLFDEIRSYLRWKRGPRHIYISWHRELLPERGPNHTFYVYDVLLSEDGEVFWSYYESRGGFRVDPEQDRPHCERIEVTNHSDATLVNVRLKVNLQPSPLVHGDKAPPPKEMFIEFEQIRAGKQGVAFVINETPHVTHAWVLGASGTPVGGAQTSLEFTQKTFGLMVFYPHPRFREWPNV